MLLSKTVTSEVCFCVFFFYFFFLRSASERVAIWIGVWLRGKEKGNSGWGLDVCVSVHVMGVKGIVSGLV